MFPIRIFAALLALLMILWAYFNISADLISVMLGKGELDEVFVISFLMDVFTEEEFSYYGKFISGALALGFAGVMGAPVVASVCGVKAYRRGDSFLDYGSGGLLYSALFLLPGMYMAYRMFDRRVSLNLVSVGYGVLYGMWFIVPIFFCLVFYPLQLLQPTDARNSEPFWYGLFTVVYVVTGACQLYTWIRSVLSMYRLRVRHEHVQDETLRFTLPESLFFNNIYAAPLRQMFIWLLGVAVLFVITIIVGFLIHIG